MKTKEWTKEEDTVLAIVVKENQENKTFAFTQASVILKRSVSACCNRWYKALNNPEHKSYVGYHFSGIETQKEEEKPVKVSLWRRIINWFK